MAHGRTLEPVSGSSAGMVPGPVRLPGSFSTIPDSFQRRRGHPIVERQVVGMSQIFTVDNTLTAHNVS
jgi:hypothetical protein